MDKESQNFFQLFMNQFGDSLGLTDKEADALYSMWKTSSSNTTRYSSNALPKNMVLSLKTKGYIHGGLDQFELTEKGRKLIVEMATNESSILTSSHKSRTYSEIKQNKCARKRQTFTKKASIEKDGFNYKNWKEAQKKQKENDTIIKEDETGGENGNSN